MLAKKAIITTDDAVFCKKKKENELNRIILYKHNSASIEEK